MTVLLKLEITVSTLWFSLPVRTRSLKRIYYSKQVCLAHPFSFECRLIFLCFYLVFLGFISFVGEEIASPLSCYQVLYGLFCGYMVFDCDNLCFENIIKHLHLYRQKAASSDNAKINMIKKGQNVCIGCAFED